MIGAISSAQPPDWLPSLPEIALLLGALVALRTLATALSERWKRTLGRRGDVYRRLARLGVGAQLSFFAAVIGEPPAIKRAVMGTTYDLVSPDRAEAEKQRPGRRRWWRRAHEEEEEREEATIIEQPKTFTESIFVDRYFFLQTISDESGTVEAFSVTTRHRRFNPTFTGLPRPSRRLERAWRWIRSRGYPGYFFKIKLGRTTFSEAGGARKRNRPLTSLETHAPFTSLHSP